MFDNLTPEQRRVAMRRVKSKNTSPEMAIRRLLHEIGVVGYRLHRRDLPGNPDVAWLNKKAAVFVHGCFWHGHDCARGSRKPKTNQLYWQSKLARNVQRDSRQRAALRKEGWSVLTIWECELKDKSRITAKLRRFLARLDKRGSAQPAYRAGQNGSPRSDS